MCARERDSVRVCVFVNVRESKRKKEVDTDSVRLCLWTENCVYVCVYMQRGNIGVLRCVCVCVRVCVNVCVCVCVYVCLRERDRARKRV